MRIKRKPYRRSKSAGPFTVHTSDAHISSVSFKAGWLRRNKRDGWHLKLPLGYYIPLSWNEE
jgi:hypothetical protein